MDCSFSIAAIMRQAAASGAAVVADAPPATDLLPISLDARLRDLEAELIARALQVAGGNKTHAARLLQIKRTTLADRMKRVGR